MNLIDLIKESWLFDERFKGITGPLIVASALWLIRSIRRVFFPFIWIFKNNLSSGFLNLSVDDRVNSLKLIGEYKENADKHDVLMRECKLKNYGLLYPIPILKTLFDYVHDHHIQMNSIGFLSYLDCNQIFDYDRNTMPTYSSKKIIIHVAAHVLFLSFLTIYFWDLFKIFDSLPYGSDDIIKNFGKIMMIPVFIVVLRFFYILIRNLISFFWAVGFSKKLNKYHLSMKRKELIDKYKI
ncbi:hypothetical protein [Dickeya zeae]|uniref:hypothetical protein n=1 Tax=Dickeya zeae TaxID=204042 RepID=UPI000C9D1B67|nr:hypothetical protein [Dickeya zeae]AUQ25123.1 hypothetical protein C1O30_08610 [Dickeya zeae]UJR58206.1 hypothetical protein HJ580_08510 [Dickeya zeae]UJR62216.1 hypothetical protein HJ586_08335 [Dickeya zeae]